MPTPLVLVLLAAATFTPVRDVDARDQPNGPRVVARLPAGAAVPFLKVGGPGRAWCKVRTDGGPGWVPCESGDRIDAPAPSGPAPRADGSDAGPGAARGCPTTCDARPLFPEPVPLTALDREVLALCPARPDASVSAEDVRRFFRAHLDDPRLQQALSAAGRPGDREAAVAWLTSLWVGTGPRNAFTHVFCGDDWTRGAVGGLHWLPRYAELERAGRLCYRGPAGAGAARANGQYRIRFAGVAPWSCAVKRVGGFTEEHDPVALAALATRAFARCCPRGGTRDATRVYEAPDLAPGQAFRIACGTRNGTYGIATFYPVDDRPTCRD